MCAHTHVRILEADGIGMSISSGGFLGLAHVAVRTCCGREGTAHLEHPRPASSKRLSVLTQGQWIKVHRSNTPHDPF